MRIYKNKMRFCESCGNSSLGAFFALLKFFGHSQTISLVSRPKNFKNTKLPPQILELFMGKLSSLRDSATAKSWQSKTFSSLRWSKAEDKSNFLPLPCGGGIRGWVKTQNDSSAKFLNNDSTHPLHYPVARDGESQAYSHKSTTKDTL